MRHEMPQEAGPDTRPDDPISSRSPDGRFSPDLPFWSGIATSSPCAKACVERAFIAFRLAQFEGRCA